MNRLPPKLTCACAPTLVTVSAPKLVPKAQSRHVELVGTVDAADGLAGDELQTIVNQSMTLTPALVERIRQTIRQ
jgi:hypothetical protein